MVSQHAKTDPEVSIVPFEYVDDVNPELAAVSMNVGSDEIVDRVAVSVTVTSDSSVYLLRQRARR